MRRRRLFCIFQEESLSLLVHQPDRNDSNEIMILKDQKLLIHPIVPSLNSSCLPRKDDFFTLLTMTILKDIHYICVTDNEEFVKSLSKYFPIVLYRDFDGLSLINDDRPFPLRLNEVELSEIWLNDIFNLDDDAYHHPGVRSLLFWLRRPNIKITIDPHLTSRHSKPPSYLISPIKLLLKPSISTTTASEISNCQIIILSGDEPPDKIYCICLGSSQANSYNLVIVEPAFKDLFIKYELIKKPESSQSSINSKILPLKRSLTDQSFSSQVSFNDPSITLGNWTPLDTTASQPLDSIKLYNKNMLKKLLLLSLRHIGVDKHHTEFASIWKHLYCGCLFALRKELTNERIDQSSMLAIIRSNMNFLNIK